MTTMFNFMWSIECRFYLLNLWQNYDLPYIYNYTHTCSVLAFVMLPFSPHCFLQFQYVMSKGWITYWICICSYDFWRWIWSLRSCLTDRYDIYKYSCQRFHHVLYFHNECQTHCHTMKDQQNSAFIHDRRTTGSASKKDWQFFPPYVFRIHNADMFEDFQKMCKRKRYL